MRLGDLSLIGQLLSQGSLGQGRSALELSIWHLSHLLHSTVDRPPDDKVLLEILALVLLAAFIAFIALGAISVTGVERVLHPVGLRLVAQTGPEPQEHQSFVRAQCAKGLKREKGG